MPCEVVGNPRKPLTLVKLLVDCVSHQRMVSLKNMKTVDIVKISDFLAEVGTHCVSCGKISQDDEKLICTHCQELKFCEDMRNEG